MVSKQVNVDQLADLLAGILCEKGSEGKWVIDKEGAPNRSSIC